MRLRYRIIPGYPGYRVGTDGSVWTCRVKLKIGLWMLGWKWKRMKQAVSKGYRVVSLFDARGNKRQGKVHRLVLLAFRGPCPPGMVGRHFPDRNTDNNRLDNLSWATHQQNIDDRDTHGMTQRGEKHYRAKLTVDKVKSIRQRVANGEPQAAIAREFGMGTATIGSIVHMQTWKSVGPPPFVEQETPW